jgi:hypothetical protein
MSPGANVAMADHDRAIARASAAYKQAVLKKAFEEPVSADEKSLRTPAWRSKSVSTGPAGIVVVRQ